MSEELIKAAQQALMECPFCGSEPHDAQHIEYGRWAVTCRCGTKGASANTGPNATDAAKIKAYSDARTAWNTRALTQRPAAQTEREADGLPLIVAGAIFDFAGFMTTRSEVIEVGSTAEAGPVADLVKEWAELRGLDLADAAVLSWQLHIIRASLPAPQQATPDQFADASNMVAPVALRSVHLTRDMAGMCFVRINGRVAIRDNGDLIDHMATLEWFADTQQATPTTSGNILTDAFNEVQALKQQATPEPVGEVVYQIKGDSFECPHAWRDATEEAFYTTPAADRRILYTRPAPGVPEGFALVPVVPTKAMTTAVEHAMWERPSVNGSDVWSAVLAAAQAKGGE